MVNMLFWFIISPTGIDDPIKTIVTSMAAVLTTSMTLRIILSVRGSLSYGGSFAVSSTSHSSRSGGTTHVISTNRNHGGVTTNPVLSIQQQQPAATYTVPLQGKERDWVGGEYDNKSAVVVDNKEGVFPIDTPPANPGVKITIDTETDFGPHYGSK